MSSSKRAKNNEKNRERERERERKYEQEVLHEGESVLHEQWTY